MGEAAQGHGKDDLIAHLEPLRPLLPPPKAAALDALIRQYQSADAGVPARKEMFLNQLKSIMGPELMARLVNAVKASRTSASAVQRPPGAIQPPPGTPGAHNVAAPPVHAASLPSPHNGAHQPLASPAPGPSALFAALPLNGAPLPLSLPPHAPSPSPSPLPIANALRPAPPLEAPQAAKRARVEAPPRVAFAVPTAPAAAPSAAAAGGAGGAGKGGGGEGEEEEEGGGGGGQSVKALMDVTRIAGVDLKLEAASLEAGGDDDEEGGARVVQPESLVLAPDVVRPLVAGAVGRLDAAMRVDENVHALLAHAAHERLRSLIEQLVVLSAHRHDAARGVLHAAGDRDPRRTLKLIEKREREARERREEEERERALREAREQEAALRRQKGEGTAEALQETRERLSAMKTEDEEVRRTKSTNSTASLAIGERRKLPVAPVPLPLPAAKGAAAAVGGGPMAAAPTPALSTGQLRELKELQELIRAGRALTPEQAKALALLQTQLQRRPASAPAAPQVRRITKRDLLTLLASDPHSRTSRLVLAPRGKLVSEK